MNRLEWILTGLLAVLVIAVLALFLLFWSEQQQIENINRQVAAAATVAEERGTAKSAYEVVAPAAHNWAEDAVLLNTRGNWPAGTSFAPEQGSWSFLFYSPQQRAVALIATEGDRAEVVSENQTTERFNPESTAGWQTDSPAVVEQLLANGGQAFIEQHGEVSLIVSLNAMKGLVWTATLNATNADKLFRLQIDPTNGQIIE